MADDSEDTTETAMRHVGDPGTAEIVVPGDVAPDTLTAAAGILHGSALGADAGYAEIPAGVRGEESTES